MGIFVNSMKAGAGFISAYLAIYIVAALLVCSGFFTYKNGVDKHRDAEKYFGIAVMVVGGLVFLPSILGGAASSFGSSLFQ